MDFLGVGPAEFVFIFLILLVVVGPERLPEIGRFLGNQLARLMAWQAQSPEYQTVHQIHQDMQREIVDLRDEILRTRQQIASSAQSVHDEVRSIQHTVPAAIKAGRFKNSANTSQATPAASTTTTTPPVSLEKTTPPAQQTPSPDVPAAQTETSTNGVDEKSNEVAALRHEMEQTNQHLMHEIETLRREMDSLKKRLHAAEHFQLEQREVGNNAPAADDDHSYSQNHSHPHVNEPARR